MHMQLTDAPKLRPCLCLDGTGGGDGPIVDTLITTKMPGRIYLSRRHVREAARLLGFPEPEQHALLEQAVADAAVAISDRDARIAELEGELAELQSIRSAIDRAAERWQTADAA